MTNHLPNPDKEKLYKLIEEYKELNMPDRKLTKKIMQMLRIYEIVELEFTLNSYEKDERLAAMRMIEKHLDDLLSNNAERWKAAKNELAELYYEVASSDEEALL